MQRSVLTLCALLSIACGSDKDAEIPAFRHQALYEMVETDLAGFTVIDGDFKEDFGDGAFYGLAFLSQAGETEDNQTYRDAAQAIYERNLVTIAASNLLTGDTNEIAMSALGLVEYMDATGDRTHLGDLDGLIRTINDVVAALGYYLPAAAAPGYAMDTYGPTAVNGLMALLGLQRCSVLGCEGAEDMVAASQRVASRIDEYAWNGAFYEFDDGVTRPGLDLYPNLTMIILAARLYQLTQESSYLERALAAYRGMQALKVGSASGLVGAGRYRSPYSAHYIGAMTDDYTTLSSQNYLVLALMLLYQVTGEVSYLREVDPVLDFLEQDLHGPWCLGDFHRAECEPICAEAEACLEDSCVANACGEGILHHWMDGRIAQPDAPEYVCSGCNYQLMYLLWYRQNKI